MSECQTHLNYMHHFHEKPQCYNCDYSSIAYSTESPLWFTDRLCSQNDFLSDFYKCVIKGSDTAKSCQIIYVTKLSLQTHGIVRLLPDTRKRCFKNVRRFGTWEGGPQGAACKSITAASLFHSLSVNTIPFGHF